MKNKNRFSWRALSSEVVAFSFVFLVVSGGVLFVSPPGRVANWTDWRMFGFAKHDWTGLHVWFSTVFLISAIAHLVFNFRPMLGYFKDRLTRRIGFRWEWTVAIILVGLVFLGTRAGVPPFSTLLAFEEKVKNNWENSLERAPIPHAELLTVQELSEKAGVPLHMALERLKAQKLSSINPDIIVADLASKNDISAQRVYEIIQVAEGGRADGQTEGLGGGIGWKTLEQFCADEGIAVGDALARLEAHSISASAEHTMREIASSNGFERPFEMLNLVRGE